MNPQPRRRRWLVLVVLGLQLAVLRIGVGRDYELKHEDNNALHATFARSHLALGFGVTRGQNYFYDPVRETGSFYAHHPPAPGLILALVYRLTGRDGPEVTRTTAILLHVVATWLFYGLARRVFRRDWEVVLATALFAGLPESSFFGRMMNHEVVVLPAALLVIRGYWEWLRGGWSSVQAMAVMVGGMVWAALAGWAGFFAIGACALHAVWEVGVRGRRRARTPLLVLSTVGLLLFALDVLHLVWVLGGDRGYLTDLLASRIRPASPDGLGGWLGRIVELHWRYFGLTSVGGLGVLAYRGVGGLRSVEPGDPAVGVGTLFLGAGLGYVMVFNTNAAQHDYWQFLLVPASAIGLTLVYRWAVSGVRRAGPRPVWVALLVVVSFEVLATTVYTLQDRHSRPEAYCLRVVEGLRRQWL